jgi:two-component system sensor histidine kinase UhpB
MPVFWRIFLTNLITVLGGALLATWLTDRFVAPGAFTTAMHVAMIVVALALSALIIWFGVRHTFRPLRELRRAIDAFYDGHPNARATPVRGGDPDTREVAAAVNHLWDELQRANATVAEQNRRLVALTAQVISAQEEERRRIARELHDEAGQALTMLIVGLERGEQSMPGEHLAAARATVRRLRDLATQTLEEIRNLALDLRPALLDDLGLVAAVRWYARTCAARAGLPVDVALDGLDESDRLPPDVETAVFRIVQEGITNAVKHARAGRVWVGLHRDEGGLTVLVADDGVGLPPFEAANGDRGGRLGLFGMAERAKLLGGEIEIGPRPGGGTLLELRLPLAGVAVGKVSGERSPHPGPPQAGEGAVRLA